MGEEGEEMVVLCQMEIGEQNHNNRADYDMLFAQMEIRFHMLGVGQKDPLDSDCILLDSCSTLWEKWKASLKKL